MNKPTIGIREKKEEVKIVHPKQCKKCGGKVLGWGTIIGSGWINLSDMSVDECADTEDFEVYDEESLEYICQEEGCDCSWRVD